LRQFNNPPAAFVETLTRSYPDQPYLRAIAYIDRCTSPGEPILALPLLTNIYYLAGRPFGGGQMLLVPGFFTTDEDQELMIERLQAHPAALMLDMPGFQLDGMESRRVESFAPLVHDYLERAFEDVGPIGPIMARLPRQRPLAGPDRASCRSPS
jgi:hypothetical protein